MPPAALRASVLAVWLAVASTAGCGWNAPAGSPTHSATPTSGDPARPGWAARFVDVAQEAGVRYRLTNGGKSPLSIYEVSSGGCALLDWNGDDRLDLLLTGPPRCALYTNTGDGRFRDDTAAAGLAAEGRWMGCAVGDYDNDGFPDVLVTGYRCLRLWHNEGGKRFRDATAEAGLATELWTTSAAFSDLDRDGRLDLYVGAYVKYFIGRDDDCPLGKIRAACGPEHYPAERGRLYRNVDGKRFHDVTRQSGLHRTNGKTWGVGVADADEDGWPDLYLANDMAPCDLFRNRGGWRFENVGLSSGTAFDASGHVQGGMGVDWGDVDQDGKLDLLVTTYYQQAKALYRSLGNWQFDEVSRPSGLALPALQQVAFGCGFLDADNDGDSDLFMTSGHIRDNIADFDPGQSYAQPMQLFANDEGTFREVSAQVGPAFNQPLVGRGAAWGDYDEDGDLDLVVANREGYARLLRNEGGNQAGRWLGIRLTGTRSNRDGIGARVTLWSGQRRQTAEVQRARSVMSAVDPTLHFGLGDAGQADRVEIRWPDGQVQQLSGVPAGKVVVVREGASAAGTAGRRPPEKLVKD